MGFVIVSQSNLATIRNSVEIIANVIHDCRPILVQSLKQMKDKHIKCKQLVTHNHKKTECTNYMVQVCLKNFTVVQLLKQAAAGIAPEGCKTCPQKKTSQT
jgi:hypothetical protein